MILRRINDWWSVWTRPRPLGERGERAAVKHLRRRGYRILARDFRRGELDIVAVQDRTIVFVEVKTRQSAVAGEPSSAVDETKQARVTRGAQGFLKRHGLEGYAARFDVIAVTWPDGQRRPQIEHLESAFPALGD